MIMNIIIYIGTIFVIIATFIPLLKNEHWAIRSFDFAKQQIAFIATIILALILIEIIYFQNALITYYIFSGILILSIIYQVSFILPYTPIWTTEVKNTKKKNLKHVSLLVSNVLMDNKKTHLLLKLIKKYNPDIIMTLETNSWWEKQLNEIEEKYPYQVKKPLENLYGMHLYSKYKLSNTEIKYLVENEVPSIHTDVNIDAHKFIKLHCIHPAPPSPSENETSQERDAELLIVGREVKKSDQTTIVAGDLNDVAWSPTSKLFKRTSELLDPRVGRGLFCTYNAKYAFMRWPLDHIFHTPDLTLISMKRLPSIGSDHFPIYAKFAINPINNNEQPETADQEDKKWVKKKIQQVK